MADREKFAEKMRQALVRAGKFEGARYNPERFALVYERGAMFLGNAFEEYSRAGFFSKGAVIRRWVSAFAGEREAALPETFDEARGNLLPFVRDAAYFDYLRLMRRAHSETSVHDIPMVPLGADLQVALAYDTPRTISTVPKDDLDKWKVGLEEALKSAQFNLRARTPDGLTPVAPGVFASPYRDNHDAARIVLTELISRLDVRGDPVALVPHRDALIVTGSEDGEGLQRACALAEPLVKENRRVSGSALVFRGGRWEPFAPPPGSPAGEPLRRLRMTALANDYGQQAELLQKVEGEGTFVATYQVIEIDGQWTSYSVWTEGITSSLPRTDKIGFFSDRFAEDDPRRGLKDWSVIEARAGALLERQDLHPERVLVRSFPGDEVLR